MPCRRSVQSGYVDFAADPALGGKVFGTAIVEGGTRSFKHVDHMQIQLGSFDGTHRVLDAISSCPIDMGMNDLLRVAHYGNVWTVGHHDQLAALLNILDDRNQEPVDGVIVEILLRLVDYDRITALVDEKVEHQQQSATLARRQVAQFLAVEPERVFRFKIFQRPKIVIKLFDRRVLAELVGKIRPAQRRRTAVVRQVFENALDKSDRVIDLIEIEVCANFLKPDRAFILTVERPGDSLVNVLLEEVPLKGVIDDAAFEGQFESFANDDAVLN